MQIGILEPNGFSTKVMDMLKHHGASISVYRGTELKKFLAPVKTLFVRLAYKIDSAFLDMAPELRYLCSPTTGHNHIDIDALQVRGIKLFSLQGERGFLETIRATPEHTFGLILALLRRYGKAFSETRTGAWDRNACVGEELQSSLVGIIGLGRVGYRVASYCDAFGANVYWCDTADVPSQPGWRRVPDIRSLIDLCHIVVLCASHNSGQDPIIGEAEIKSLEGKYFVNTARGELVDEPRLLSAISNNMLAGVGVDVVANENGNNLLSEWRELLHGRNVLLTPHIAGATKDAMKKTEMFIAQKFLTSIKEGQML